MMLPEKGPRSRRLPRGLALLLAALLLWVLLPARLLAVEAEPDHLALAAMLVRDGKYERASTELAKVDPSAKGTDLITYHTVSGLIALNRQEPRRAVDAFLAAIAAGQSEPTLYLYLAQAQFTLERYDDVLDTLARGGSAFDAMPAVALMRAQALWSLRRHQQAFDELAKAAGRFPGNLAFQRRQVFYLIELGLYQQASALGRDYLARAAEAREEDYLAIGSALRRARQPGEAQRFLEGARLRFPDSIAIDKQLAAVLVDQGQPLAAAERMAQAAGRDPALLAEAAELFRRAGHLQRALSLNAGIADQKVKLKQRLGLLLDGGRHAEVAAMADALERSRVVDEEEVRYALAYALYKGGDFVAAERHLTRLTKPELFRKATELRRLMAECEGERWRCA